MRRDRLLFWAFWALIAPGLWAQETAPATFMMNANLEPVAIGLRFDDNVLRSVVPKDRLSDEIYSLNWGGSGSANYDIFRGDLSYQLGADQYQLYASQNNFRNNLSLALAVDPGEFSLSYKKVLLFRTSSESNYNYFDDGNYFDAQWLPSSPWLVDGEYRNYSRSYYDPADAFQSREFVDQSGILAVQREFSDQISIRLEGRYNDRQFNRNQVTVSSGVTLIGPGSLQADETWSGKVSAHLYIESVLQDFQFEHQRTNSNSYGFSNSVDSLSWAAVLKPAPSLYLQLFFRLYTKTYDAPPIMGNPDLQIGYVDEDSQDLLAIKTSWEWSPQWTLNLGISRLRSEYTQPGQFYIKDIFSAEVQRNF